MLLLHVGLFFYFKASPVLLLPAAGKLVGLDKKLSKSLDHEVMTGSSPLELSASPIGPLSEAQR